MMFHPSPEMLELEDQSAALRLSVRQAGFRLRRDFSGRSDEARHKGGLLETTLSVLKTLPVNRSMSAIFAVAASGWIQARLHQSSKPRPASVKTETDGAHANASRRRKSVGSLAASVIGLIGLAAGIGLAKVVPVSALERSMLAEHKPQVIGLFEGIVDQSLNSARQSLVEAFGLSKLLATVVVLFGMAASVKR
jgi:hypothetical protein